MRRRRARAKSFERVVGEYTTVIHDDDAISEALGFLHVVRGVEQRLAAGLELLEVVEDGVAALRIDTVGSSSSRMSGSCSRPAARLRRRFMPPL